MPHKYSQKSGIQSNKNTGRNKFASLDGKETKETKKTKETKEAKEAKGFFHYRGKSTSNSKQGFEKGLGPF
jgi:hypothetical protein